jgi:hypothetical protein
MLNKPLYRRWSVIATFILFAAILCSELSSHAAPGPQPPCGSATFPPYPDLEKSPIVVVWDSAELGPVWTPPACIGWSYSGLTTMVVTVARFRHASGVEGLLRRVGAVSERTGIQYWSTTRKRWHTLVINAYALSEAVGDRRRKDFSPHEMAEGGSLYFQQEDSLSGKAIYRMRVRSASPDRLVFDTENISIVRYFLIPIFRPGDIQSIYFFERESQDVWRYYGIVRTSKIASLLTSGNEASYINRSVAFYRYLTGVSTDKEPPASP